MPERSVAMFERKGFIILVLFFGGILFLQFGLPYESRGDMEDDYPNKPIQVIVAWSPGNSSDLSARYLAPYLGEYFKQPFVVNNKPGAGGVIGHTLIAKSKPDGYTLGAVSTLAGVYLLVVKDLEFDLESFVPICAFIKTPGFFLVRPEAPWKTMKEFVADAKKNPGKLRYSSIGVASALNLMCVAFCKKAGIELTHIPYAGMGDVLTALIGGHVDVAPSWGSVGHLKSGTLRALAVSEKERLEDYPDIPTLTELGYPIVCYPITGHVAPKGTPKKITDKLIKGYLETLRANQKAISDLGRKYDLIPIIMSPDEYYKRIRADYEFMREAFQGIKVK